MSNTEKKSAVVTGGTRGIGLAISYALLERGASVLICSRKEDEVARAVATLESHFGDRIHGIACDVSSLSHVQSLFRRANEIFGDVDILINNAGIG